MKTCTYCKQEKDTNAFEKGRNQCRKCRDESRKKMHSRGGEGLRYYNLKKKYGISKEQYLGLSARQNDLCGICGKANQFGPWPDGRLAVDHCHKTGQIRGLLCDKCNKGLGQFDDNPERLAKAIQYLA